VRYQRKQQEKNPGWKKHAYGASSGSLIFQKRKEIVMKKDSEDITRAWITEDIAYFAKEFFLYPIGQCFSQFWYLQMT
jgi:hypothetical protein